MSIESPVHTAYPFRIHRGNHLQGQIDAKISPQRY